MLALPSRCSLLALVACSSSAKAPAPPAPAAAPPPDAAVDAASPDAGIPPTAAVWRFRYNKPPRVETWTLRFGDGHATVDVESGQGTLHYFGTAVEGESVKLDVATSSAKITLDCKRAKRPLGTKCNFAKPKPADVLDCYHPDFKEPMPFGPEPGVEYVDEPKCTGYRVISSP